MKRALFILAFAPSLFAQYVFSGFTPTAVGGGGPAFVQADHGAAVNAASVTSVGIATTTGHMLAVGGLSFQPCTTQTATPSDTALDAFTLVTTQNDTGNNTCTYLWYAKNITGNASNKVTITWGTAAMGAVSVLETSGNSTTAPFDASATGLSGLGSFGVTSGSFTTTSAAEILIAACAADTGTFTAGTGYTFPAASLDQAAPSTRLGMEYKVVSSTQTGVTAGFTGTVNTDYSIIVGTFK